MRKKRDGAGTKTLILERSEKLFAEKGFNGTSLAEVSAESGISVGLILYHFKSKEKLYDEVIEKISGRYMRVLSGIREKELAPAEMVREALEAVFNFWNTDTTYHRISLWSYLEGRKNAVVNESRLTVGLAAYLTSLQDSGNFPKEIEPAVFLSMIIGPIHFWFRYKARFVEILRLKGDAENMDDLFLDQFTAILTSFFNNNSHSQ